MSLFNFFPSLFRKSEHILPKLTNDALLKSIEELDSYDDLTVIYNSHIYYDNKTLLLPLLIVDKYRGLYIFELRGWTQDELQNMEIRTQKVEERKENNLGFSLIQDLLQHKASEVFTKEAIPIFNFLILESLTSSQYDALDSAIQKALPKESLIFQDMSSAEIYQKLQSHVEAQPQALKYTDELLHQIYPQYTIMQEEKPLFATTQQRNFIEMPLSSITTLQGKAKSGKSSIALLKIVTTLIQTPQKSILMLCANEAAKEKLIHQLQNLTQTNSIAIENVKITTAKAFLEDAYSTVHVNPVLHDIQNTLYIDKKLLKKRKQAADLLICDDAQLLEEHFLNYLEIIQKKAQLLFINHPKEKGLLYTLSHSFFSLQKEILFMQTHPLIQTIHHLTKTLTSDNEKVVVFCNELHQQKLQEDLKDYLKEEQHASLSYANYNTIEDISIPHIILLDICQFKPQRVEYALTRATKSVALFYEQECDTITTLKETYES